MITLSSQKIKNDGILFIVWGWIAFISNFLSGYLAQVVNFSPRILLLINYISKSLYVVGLLYTLYYLYRNRSKTSSYTSIFLRYVWIGLIISMVLINLIQFNVLGKIHFELQHPIFMVLIALAITITGVLLRYKPILLGGIIFAGLAYLASLYVLHVQLLIEAIGWLIAFIIPGHILYSQRHKHI